MGRRGWRWFVAVGLVLGWASVAPLGVVADDAVVAACTEADFDEALETAHDNGGGTITFTCSGVIPFTDQKVIEAEVTIIGGGEVTFDGQDTVRLFEVLPGATLVLDGLMLQNGRSSEHGGAIFNEGTVMVTRCTFLGNLAQLRGGAIYSSSGTLEFTDSTFSGNVAEQSEGGAIFTGGPMAVNTSTFSDNRSGGQGGAIFSDSDSLDVTASTFSDNFAYASGGAIYNAGGQLTVTASTFSGNIVDATFGGAILNFNIPSAVVKSSIFVGNVSLDLGMVFSCFGPITSGGYNVSDDRTCSQTVAGDIANSTQIRLGPLRDNGGPTQTMLPLPGAAFDTIPAAICGLYSTAEDQRGVTRPQGANCEAGAVEAVMGVCANRYTGELSLPSRSPACPPASAALVLPSLDMVTLCIHPSTGAITWAPLGACASALRAHVMPDAGPLTYCQHVYSGALRYTRTGACSPVERAGVMPVPNF